MSEHDQSGPPRSVALALGRNGQGRAILAAIHELATVSSRTHASVLLRIVEQHPAIMAILEGGNVDVYTLSCELFRQPMPESAKGKLQKK